MSHVDLEKGIELLKEFAWTRRQRLEVLLIGGLAIQYYGMENRATLDIDAEIKGDLASWSRLISSSRN